MMKADLVSCLNVLHGVLSQREIVRASNRVSYPWACCLGLFAVWAAFTPWWMLGIVHTKRPIPGGYGYLLDLLTTLPAAVTLGLFPALVVTAGLSLLLQIFVGSVGDRRVIAGMLSSWRWLVLAWLYLVCRSLGLIAEHGARFWGGAEPLWIKWPVWSWATSRWSDLVMLFALLLITVWSAKRTPAKFSKDANLCEACEYDLRATVAAGIKQCPECGAKVDLLGHGARLSAE